MSRAAECGMKKLGERERGDREDQGSDMNSALVNCIRKAGQPVCIEVAEEECGLEEDETRQPNRRGTAEDRENLFGGQRLDQKEEKSREKSGGPVEKACRWHELGAARILDWNTALGLCVLHRSQDRNTEVLT